MPDNSSLIEKLHSKGLIKPPPFVRNPQYEVLMGSISYGVAGESSDWDIYGFCIPPKDVIFPHLRGEIPGFGTQIQRFEQYQQHHIFDSSSQKEYDLAIYNIVKYFHLLMQNNPNIIDSLFVPRECILFSTKIADMIRDNRKIFLHKGSWHKFKGYAYSQMNKMKVKDPDPNGKRYKLVSQFGFDVKFAYHVVRLLNEVEMIMVEQDLDLRRNKEQLKAIRNGEWTLDQIEQYFFDKEKLLEEVYLKSTLPHSPDEEKIKGLLLSCLEEYYGTLENCIIETDTAMLALKQIAEIANRSIR